MGCYLLTWVLACLLRHVLAGEEQKLDCSVLPIPTLVPMLDKDTDNTESVSFAGDLVQLFNIFKTLDDPSFTVHPENTELIIPDSLDVCHYIGKPISWGKLQSIQPTGKYVSVMEGYFGLAEQTVESSKVSLEVCQFDNTLTYGSAKCNEMLNKRQHDNNLESLSYGDVTNKLLVLGIRGNRSEWLEIGADSDLPLVCLATPLTHMLSKLKILSQEIFCSLNEMFGLLGQVEGVAGCQGVRYHLARYLLRNDPEWHGKIVDTCATLSAFECPKRETRSTTMGSKLVQELSKRGVDLLTKLVNRMTTKLLPATLSKIHEAIATPISDFRMTSVDIIMAMRFSNKIRSIQIQNELLYSRMLSFATNLISETKFAVNGFMSKYKLVIDKLTLDQVSCVIQSQDLSVGCSRDSVLDTFKHSEITLISNKIKFKRGNLYYINCLTKQGYNFIGNRQIFLKVGNKFTNNNLTVPESCLTPDTYSEKQCKLFKSTQFQPNFWIENQIELTITGDDQFQLTSENKFTVKDVNQAKSQKSRVFNYELDAFPLSISGPGFIARLTLNNTLNKVGKGYILDIVKQNLPVLKEFALSFQKEFLNIEQAENWTPFHYATVTLTVVVVILLIIIIIILVRSCSARKIDKSQQNPVNLGTTLLEPGCPMPMMQRGPTFDAAKFRQDMLNYVQSASSSNSTPFGNLNPADAKLFNVVLLAVEKAEHKAKQWFCSDEKTQHDLIFEIGFMLYSDLATRMCTCAFPVHVCIADMPNAQVRYDGVGRMKEYIMDKMAAGQIPTAPGSVNFKGVD